MFVYFEIRIMVCVSMCLLSNGLLFNDREELWFAFFFVWIELLDIAYIDSDYSIAEYGISGYSSLQ